MRITDIPEFKDKTHLLTIEENISVHEAVNKMAEYNYGSAVVVKNSKLVGMFTERDVLKKVAANAMNVKKTKVSEVMTKKVKTAHYDSLISDSLRRMSQGRFRHLPIVDKKGKLQGMVSQGDLVSYSWPQIFNLLGHKAKSSFLTYTQIWVLLLAIFAYITVMTLFVQ
ncbi:MAG: CBS domain-containing protein [Rickettsiales bacterium]|nr:CBS domain-containing protein [Rickettsiales bacterium]